ncbi:MAG: DUF1648 domain-containing protein [bacterium]
MNTDTDNKIQNYVTASWVIVGVGILAAIIAYLLLPAIVPTHFGMNGEPDQHGSKNSLIITPIIVLAVNIFFQFMAKRPVDKFNYPVEITPANADAQHGLMRYFFAMMRVIVVSVMTLVYGLIIASMFIGHTDMRAVVLTMALVIVSVIVPALVYGIKASNLK